MPNTVDVCDLSFDNMVDSASVTKELRNIFKNDTTKRFVSFLLYKISKQYDINTFTYNDLTSNKLNLEDCYCLYIKQYITKSDWKKVCEVAVKYDNPDLFACAAYIGDTSDFDYTPDAISNLALKILNIKNSEKVADLCSGAGSFLFKARRINKNNGISAKYFGYEINSELHTLAKIINVLDAEKEIEFKQLNVFDNILTSNENNKFDKIFSNYPLGLNLRNLGIGIEYLKKLEKINPSITKSTSSDWLFNSLICDLLTDDGKGVGVMTNGGTWNSLDKPIRQYFIEKGLIECVIALPERIFNFTPIQTSLIVFSKGNEKVRFIDATKFYIPGRRTNEIPTEFVEGIVKSIETDNDFTKTATYEEIAQNDFMLNPIRYVEQKITFKNAVSFGDIIKNITRGAQCKAEELDEMSSNEVTNCQYLMLANIKNGIIDKDLPYLKEIPTQYQRYCIKHENLIMSKNGIPYKVAVADFNSNTDILANGNLYIIELDRTRANPYYIKAFLDSQFGYALLKRASVGAAIMNLSVDALKNIPIPLPSLDEQNKIANEYLSARDEYLMNQLRLEKSLDKLSHVFDETAKEFIDA